MKIRLSNLRTGIFDVADVAVMAGVGPLLLMTDLHDRSAKGVSTERADSRR